MTRTIIAAALLAATITTAQAHEEKLSELYEAHVYVSVATAAARPASVMTRWRWQTKPSSWWRSGPRQWMRRSTSMMSGNARNVRQRARRYVRRASSRRRGW